MEKKNGNKRKKEATIKHHPTSPLSFCEVFLRHKVASFMLEFLQNCLSILILDTKDQEVQSFKLKDCVSIVARASFLTLVKKHLQQRNIILI